MLPYLRPHVSAWPRSSRGADARGSWRRRARPRLELLEDRSAPAVLTVNTLSDQVAPDGTLSMREAIQVVNSGSTAGLSAAEMSQISGGLGSNDRIAFSVTGTITLQEHLYLPALARDVTIQGPSAGPLIVSGASGYPGSGGFLVNSGVTAALDSLTITGSLSSGIVNQGTLTVSNCSIINNGNINGTGGGIDNEGTLTLLNCTVSGNASGGGAFVSADGGGIYSEGTLTVLNCTVSGNRASGYRLNSRAAGGGIGIRGGTATLRNTLVAGNVVGYGGDVSGAVSADSAFNLIGDGTYLTGISDGSNGNHIGTSSAPIQPLLGPLGDYGGPTQTLPLLPGSPAIDAGGPGAPPTDQRGMARVGAPDIGAFEFQKVTLPSVSTAFGPTGVVVVAVFPDGAIAQYDSSGPRVLFGGAANASVAFDGAGNEVLVVVGQDGSLVQFDSAGMHNLFGGARDASVAFNAFGQEVLDVVGLDGTLVQIDPSGTHVLFGGACTVSVGFTPSNQEVFDVVGLDGTLVQFDATGLHTLFGGAASAQVAFVGGQQVLEVVGLDGSTVQLDVNGVHTAPLPPVLSVSTTFNAQGAQWFDVLLQDGRLFQFDGAGAHQLPAF